MRWLRLLACAALAGLLSGCTAIERLANGPSRYIDLHYPVGKSDRQQYPHTVDATGALWYIDGDSIVRTSTPSRREILRDPDVKAGTLFWYDRAVYAVDGSGTALSRIGDRLRVAARDVPSTFAPVAGAIADARHRWVVLAQTKPHELAVLDVWKWYSERIPPSIDPYASTLAGGPHGKKYLVVADARRPSIAIKNRRNDRSVVVKLPDNTCFASSSRAWSVPVDVRGRDDYRTWATAGKHVISIDLASKRILRTWDLDGCAMRILRADGDEVTVLLGSRVSNGYASTIVRVDHDGIHQLDQYGTLDGLAGGAMIDRYDRLWWYDPKARAFVCRTPLA
ncbi:MAG TPA: hypothetical protein VFE36_13790 [Candidatus Baltobacteraceae bacterium]|nr:hypothetical protein [Candidatus Baltobacteraceae bacterium]